MMNEQPGETVVWIISRDRIGWGKYHRPRCPSAMRAKIIDKVEFGYEDVAESCEAAQKIAPWSLMPCRICLPYMEMRVRMGKKATRVRPDTRGRLLAREVEWS